MPERNWVNESWNLAAHCWHLLTPAEIFKNEKIQGQILRTKASKILIINQSSSFDIKCSFLFTFLLLKKRTFSRENLILANHEFGRLFANFLGKTNFHEFFFHSSEFLVKSLQFYHDDWLINSIKLHNRKKMQCLSRQITSLEEKLCRKGSYLL